MDHSVSYYAGPAATAPIWNQSSKVGGCRHKMSSFRSGFVIPRPRAGWLLPHHPMTCPYCVSQDLNNPPRMPGPFCLQLPNVSFQSSVATLLSPCPASTSSALHFQQQLSLRHAVIARPLDLALALLLLFAAAHSPVVQFLACKFSHTLQDDNNLADWRHTPSSPITCKRNDAQGIVAYELGDIANVGVTQLTQLQHTCCVCPSRCGGRCLCCSCIFKILDCRMCHSENVSRTSAIASFSSGARWTSPALMGPCSVSVRRDC